MKHQLADLHLHFQGCIRPADLLTHLAKAKNIDWEWYEPEYRAAYGVESPARKLVERFRAGDKSAIEAFERLCIFGDEDAGNFARFLATSNLYWAGTYLDEDVEKNKQELLAFASDIKEDFIKLKVLLPRRIQYVIPRTESCRSSLHFAALLKMFDVDSEILLTMRLAVSLSRYNPWGLWKQVQEMVLRRTHGNALTAIDFCGAETTPAKEYGRLLWCS